MRAGESRECKAKEYEIRRLETYQLQLRAALCTGSPYLKFRLIVGACFRIRFHQCLVAVSHEEVIRPSLIKSFLRAPEDSRTLLSPELGSKPMSRAKDTVRADKLTFEVMPTKMNLQCRGK